MHYIFDIDDTISCSSARHHLVGSEEYFNLSINDEPIGSVVEILRSLYNYGNTIILCTGRLEQYRELTVAWLNKHNIPYDALFMHNPVGIKLRNAEAKRIMVEEIIKAGYSPVAVFEDNPLSVAMWKEHGLTVFQVA
jgi:hypothetical protein